MEFLAWLETTFIADMVRTTIWLYAAAETAHYIGLGMLVGGIMLIDLRILGIARGLPMASMIALLPWVWVGFIINAITGSLMFVYGATAFGPNKAFWLKIVFMALAGINALIFQVAATRSSDDWIAAGEAPGLVKTVATLSFVLWMAVVTTGRWMAYI